jgi:hypothetical protein
MSRKSRGAISIAFFVLAFVPRALDLGRFLTADEFLWVDRSRNFLAGLTNPLYQCTSVVEKWAFSAQGLACTLRTGHPGVTTMWTGSFGFILRWLGDGRPVPLHDYVVAISTNPLDATFIAPARFGTVLLMALWVVAVYWLARRLFGNAVALLGALLIALDPYHIALSRVIHHDALGTAFMTLSLLAGFIYWGERGGKRWLLLSGAMAGLSFLSKLSTLFLMPFIALVGLWFLVGRPYTPPPLPPGEGPGVRVSRTILEGLLWFAVALGTAFVVWPALWVVPVEALETVFFIGSKYATGGHAKGNFLLGVVSQDPGPLFYLVTTLYRLSPLVMLGAPAALVAWLRKSGDDATHSFFRYLPLILLFIADFYLLVTIAEKKQERYFLPAYPWLDLLAAAGLLQLAVLLPRRVPVRATLVALVMGVNGLLVAWTFPYYFTYYNPLLGGIHGAAQAVTIGWGEGLDEAAAYLNTRPDAAQTRVASWYESTFTPFYDGPTISYSKEKGKALAGEYVIFYINQVQRRFPDEIFFEYFESRFQPEKVITLHGLDYAWIYPSLGVDHYIQDQTYTGMASLLAWQWRGGEKALVAGEPAELVAGEPAELVAGEPAEFELYWEYLGKRPEERFFFRLVDAQGRPWAEGAGRPVAGENPPLAAWREGEILLERGYLSPPSDLPPGHYRLHIGFYTDAPAVPEGELLFTVPDDEALVAVTPPTDAPAYTLPTEAVPVGRKLGAALTLLGASWPIRPLSATETALPLDLYWRVERPLAANTELHVGLLDEAGEAQQAWFNLTLAEIFNPTTATWPPGTILHTRWPLTLSTDVPPGEYHFALVPSAPPAAAQATLSFGRLVVE